LLHTQRTGIGKLLLCRAEVRTREVAELAQSSRDKTKTFGSIR
jgi:hypothetical protein